MDSCLDSITLGKQVWGSNWIRKMGLVRDGDRYPQHQSGVDQKGLSQLHSLFARNGNLSSVSLSYDVSVISHASQKSLPMGGPSLNTAYLSLMRCRSSPAVMRSRYIAPDTDRFQPTANKELNLKNAVFYVNAGSKKFTRKITLY